MRLFLSAIALAMATPTPGMAAQVPGDSLVEQHLATGIVVALPSDWAPVNDSVAEASKQILDTLLQHSRDSLLQMSLKNGKPMMLLMETLRGHAEPSVNLNVAPSPGTRPDTFGNAPPAAVVSALAPLCDVLRNGMRQTGTRVLKCDPAELVEAAGRKIAVTRVVRTGSTGFVTVWLAQYPDRDVVYTLTLSAPEAEEAQYAPLFRRIWESVSLEPTP